MATMMSFELFTLLKECTETIKNSEHHQLKINRSYCIVEHHQLKNNEHHQLKINRSYCIENHRMAVSSFHFSH